MPRGRRSYTYVEVSPDRSPVIEERRPEIYSFFKPSRRKTVIIQEGRQTRRVRFERSPSPIIITESRPDRRRSSHHPPRIITISPRPQSRRDRTPPPEQAASRYPTVEQLVTMSPRPPPVEEDYIPLPDPLPKKSRKGGRSKSPDLEDILNDRVDRSSGRPRRSTSKSERITERYGQYEYVSGPKSGRPTHRDSSQIPRTAKSNRLSQDLANKLDDLELNQKRDKKYYEDQIRHLQRTVAELSRSERDAAQRLDYTNAQLRRIELEKAEANLREREKRLAEIIERQWAEMGAVLPVAPPGQAQVVQQPVRPVSRDVVEALIHQAQDDVVRQNEELYHTERERHRSSGQRRGSITAYPDSRNRPRYQ